MVVSWVVGDRGAGSDEKEVWLAQAVSAASGDGEWIQLVFPQAQTINEIRLKEDPSSSITRYEIQYADPETRTWVSCFNGMAIGEDFIAPIVARETRGLRLRVLATEKGGPSIREFAAYRGEGREFNDDTGAAAVKVVGK